VSYAAVYQLTLLMVSDSNSKLDSACSLNLLLSLSKDNGKQYKSGRSSFLWMRNRGRDRGVGSVDFSLRLRNCCTVDPEIAL